MNTQQAPHAFESSGFTYTEQNTLQWLEQAKQILATAYEQNPMVRSIMSTCESNGLIYVDQLRMLCANLLNQHEQASQALLNMDGIIKDLRQQLGVQPIPEPRKLVESWRSGHDQLYCRCDDGTVWKLETKRTRTNLPEWQIDRTLGAPLPQWPVV